MDVILLSALIAALAAASPAVITPPEPTPIAQEQAEPEEKGNAGGN